MKFDAGEGVPGCNGATTIVVVVTLAVVVVAVVVLFGTVVVVLFGTIVVVVVLADEEIVDGGGVVVVVVVGVGVVVVVVVGVVVVVVVVVVDVVVVDVVGVVVVVLTATVSSCAEVNPDAKSSRESATTRSARNSENKRIDMFGSITIQVKKNQQTRNEQCMSCSHFEGEAHDEKSVNFNSTRPNRAS
jgi:hypothetical protein